LVLRQAPANDRRSYIVRLTSKGTSHFSAIAKAHEAWVDELLAKISVADAGGLMSQLDTLTNHVRNGGDEP
jgi:DNA-binding MarR family transcriptional regulator